MSSEYNELYTQTDKGWISISELFKAQDKKMQAIADILEDIIVVLYINRGLSDNGLAVLERKLKTVREELSEK